MPNEYVWKSGSVTFRGTALGNCRTARLTLTVDMADCTAVGDNAPQQTVLRLGAGSQVVIDGLETDRSIETLLGQRGTLTILDSAGTTQFNCSDCICSNLDKTDSYNDATTVAFTFLLNTLPTTPAISL